MWKTVQVMGKQPPEKAANLWAEAEDNYWEAIWWLDRAVLEREEFCKGGCLGKIGNQLCGSDRAGGNDSGALRPSSDKLICKELPLDGKEERARGGKR